MSNYLEAIQKVIMLANLVQRSVESMREAAEMIEHAQREGRELTEGEIETVRARTDEAIEELRDL